VKYAEELAKTIRFRDLPRPNSRNSGVSPKMTTSRPVRVLKRDRKGDSEEVTTLGSGSYIGEVEFVRPDRHAAATIETIEKSTVISLPYEQIEKLCDEDLNLAVHFYRAIAKGLARRLAHTNEAVANYRMMAVKKKG